MEEYELLELLLTYAIPRRDTKPLAKTLLAAFGTLSGVLEAESSELRETAGIGEASLVLLKLTHVLALRSMDPIERKSDYLKSPEAVAAYFRTFLRGLREERFVAAFLDSKNRIIEEKTLQQGTVDQAVVYPRRVVEAALGCRAKSVVVVHNHPSGDSTPSKEDLKLTKDLKQALSAVGIVLLDHLIIGAGAHFSLREKGLL